MIKPTVGRIVLFYPAGCSKTDEPNAAIIAHVHSDTSVNLFVIDGNGTPFAVSPMNVLLVQDDEPPAGGNYCTWMPYQKDVAAGRIPPVQHAQPEAKPVEEPEAKPEAKPQHHKKH